MAIKRRLAVLLGLLLLGAGALSAQWKSDVAELFRKSKNYKAISDYLLPSYSALELVDKGDAAGILAYCFGRQADGPNETRWIVEYFETCGARDSGFVFLDFISQADVIGWLNVWRSRYPFVREISLIKGVGDEVLIPQRILPLVIDITTEAFYKFSLGSNVLEGGQFKSGFNIIALDANLLFLDPGRRVYLLEIKSGGLILKKEISLDVEISTPAPPPRPAPPKTQGRSSVEYKLTLYVGGELVMTSRKVEVPVEWKIGVKPSNLPFGIKPDYYVNRDKPNPLMNSIDIPRAIGILYQLLKDLLTKKGKKDVEPPKIQTVQDLSLVYPQKDADGRDQEMKVSVKLRTKTLPYVLSPI